MRFGQCLQGRLELNLIRIKNKLVMKNVLFSLLLLFALGCSRDEPTKTPCYLYRIFLSENCECQDWDFDCGMNYLIEKNEYDRLNNLKNNSMLECLEVTVETNSSSGTQQGYLINLEAVSCNFDFDLL